MMLCMVVNFLIPRFSVGQETFDSLSSLIKNQSPLLYFFSLSSLPMKMVNELLVKEIGASAKNESRPQENDSRSANTSADYSLLSTNAASYAKSVFVKAWAQVAPPTISPSAPRAESTNYIGGAPGQGFLLMFALMFFFLRPRSAIDDLIIYSNISNKTRC